HGDRPRGQGLAGAGAANAEAALRPEERAVRAAQDEVALTGQVAVADGGERRAGVRTAVDVAEHLAAAAHEETVEQHVVCPEVEAPGAGIVQVVNAAQHGSWRRLSRVQPHGSAPNVAFHGRTSTLWKRPAWV